MQLKKWFLFAVVVGISLQGLSQAAIRGSVWIDSMPAAGASVQLNRKITVLADQNGKFELPGMYAGKATLHVTAVGTEMYHQDLFIKENDTVLVIYLQPIVSSLDAIVVSGTMKAVRKLDSPIPVEVYTPQFFKRNPAPTVFESLQNINGVRPQINCSVCNTGDIHINGLEGPYTMVTIDGMPIVSSLGTVYGLYGIPTELIDRIEIVKGPASGLYGSEAIGGLINVITKTPERAPKFAGSVMATDWRELTADLGFTNKIGERLRSLTGINYFNYQHPIDNNDDGFTDVTLQHRISVFNKWSLKRNSSRQATVATRYFYENRWGGEMNWNSSFRGSNEVYGETINTKRWELIGNYDLPLPEKVTLSFSATSHQQDSYYGVTPYFAKQKIAFAQLVWDKALSATNDLMIGFAGRYNYYDDNSTATVDNRTGENLPDKNFLPGLFLQNTWKVSSDHNVLLGLRIDHHPSHGIITTPRFAWKWTTGERQSLRMNAGTGFRVVNIFTEDHAALTGARDVVIKEKLKPETSYNVNFNYVRQFGSISRQFHIDISAWYSYFNNQIIADYESDPQKIIYDNLTGYSFSKGVTLNAELNLFKRTKAMLGATLQQVSKVETRDNKSIAIRPMLTESWSGVWSISHSFPLAGWTLDYTGNLYGPMRLPLISALDPRKLYSPVWSIQNLQLTKWMNSSFEIFGGVKNLLNWTPSKNNPFIIARSHDPFDKKVQFDANGQVIATAENPYALTFDPSYVYAPNQGRRLFVGARFKIK